MHVIGPATRNWPGGIDSNNPRSVFETMSKDARDRIYGDFEYRLSEIRDIWNDPRSGISVGGRALNTLGGVFRALFRKTVQKTVEITASQADAGLYRLGVESLEAHRRFPGSNRIAPAPPEWKTAGWEFYDYGGSLNDTVDFLYWIDGNLVRPPDSYINDQLGGQ